MSHPSHEAPTIEGMQKVRPAKREAQESYQEGKSPAAWAGSMIALVGFLALTYFASFGFQHAGWTGVWACAAVIALGGLVTLVMKTQGYGSQVRDL